MMSWINTLRTSAVDLGTLAENEPPTLRKPGVTCCGSSPVFATPHLLTREYHQLGDTRPMKCWLVDGLLDAGKVLVSGCWCAVTCDELRETCSGQNCFLGRTRSAVEPKH